MVYSSTRRLTLASLTVFSSLFFTLETKAGDPTGACCIRGPVGGCYQTTELDCVSAGDRWWGIGIQCVDLPFCFLGACCLPDLGECLMFPNEECIERGGDFYGTGSLCEQFICPLSNEGACCSSAFGCYEDYHLFCFGGTFMGFETTCADFDCADGPLPTGACCQANGNCIVTAQIGCERHGDTYLGDDSTCSNCQPTPRGACCVEDICVLSWDHVCVGDNRVFHGMGTDCASVDCAAVICACPGDMNADNLLDSRDIQLFASCIIGQSSGSPPNAGCECADSNMDSAADFADVSTFVTRILSNTDCP